MDVSKRSSAGEPTTLLKQFWRRRQLAIALLTLVMIVVHLALRWAGGSWHVGRDQPLYVALVLGGLPLVAELLWKAARREFGSDLLAGISIVTAMLLGEYLAGTLVVLMLSGGEALEAYAVRGASSVLQALARRMPSVAHRRVDSRLTDVPIDTLAVGDVVELLPHEVCPVDGTVLEGHSVMDESYLTGEPYLMSKSPGTKVLSGAINGDGVLTVRADRRPIDSRYARIMQVMQQSQQQRPRLRRLGDQLGAVFTPIALVLGLMAWAVTSDPLRFLAVMVVATPCPLLIAIPVAVIGSISLAAKRAIVVRDPAALEQVDRCRTMIFDKTGTLTYGKPRLVQVSVQPPWSEHEVLSLAASLEQYSKHPLAEAVRQAATSKQVLLHEASEVHEPPGQGLTGRVAGHEVRLTGRRQCVQSDRSSVSLLPPTTTGLECVVIIDGRYAATLQFRDTPRAEGVRFIDHLRPKHRVERILLVSGDRESEVRYLAELVGITDVVAEATPEQKLEIVRHETDRGATLFVGDGINDAPALAAATVGVAIGPHSDVTTEAADAVIMDSSLLKVDEFLHIGRRMRRVALQSAVGGMAVSTLAMCFAAAGYLPPVAGALTQELIDVVAVANALRVALPPRSLVDVDGS